MSRFAEKTKVASDKSRAEIERTLTRYGADQFMYGWREETAIVAFRSNRRHIKFTLPMPKRDDPAFTETETGRSRSASAAEAAFEQAVRQRWRALALVIKAKLEAVEAGITEFDDEFMAHIVLPNGQTIGHWMRPQIESAYSSGKMPPLIEGPEAG